VIFFTLMTASFVAANTLTESSNAIILQYTSTFWIFGLSPWLLREKPHAGDVRLLIVAMVGIAIIFAANATTDALGLVLAMSAGLFFALLSLMIRQMRDSDSAAITVLNNLGSAVLLLPVAWLVADLWLSPRALVLMIFMGIVQFGMPYYLYTLGLARVPAYQASLLTMIEPVLVPVWTYLAVGEKVPVATAIGGGLILVALVLFVWRARARAAEAMAEARALEA
jgi:drug/metabolite transporter (DMT)-like permease